MRTYDPDTDRFIEVPMPVQTADDRSYVRHQALLAAIEAAKLGLAHDIYATAGRYARWLATGAEEAAPNLPFQERLRALVDECRRSGEVDDALVIHAMQVVMGYEPAAPLTETPSIDELERGLVPRPEWAGNSESAADAAAQALQEGRI